MQATRPLKPTLPMLFKTNLTWIVHKLVLFLKVKMAIYAIFDPFPPVTLLPIPQMYGV